jgi:hypothetical protein
MSPFFEHPVTGPLRSTLLGWTAEVAALDVRGNIPTPQRS